MGSATVRAQKHANASNEALTRETNALNYQIASEANQWNRENLIMQNDWNVQQWQRENEYNSPQQQVERLLAAGINPLWAMTGSDGGQAQHLESGSPLPAEVAKMVPPQVIPEYDPTKLSNIVAASRDVVNSLQGFARLGLETEDVATRRMAAESQAGLNLVTAAQKRAATTGQEIENRWNLETFGVRVKQESQKLSNMEKQLSLMDSQSEHYKSLKANYDASTELTREKIAHIAEDYQLAWKEISIKQQSANAQTLGAQASMVSAEAQKSQAETSAGRLELDSQISSATVQKWNNDQLLDFLKAFGRTITGELKAGVTVSGLGVSGKAGLKEMTPASLELMHSAGLRAIEWSRSEPNNPEAVEAASIATEITDKLRSSSGNIPSVVDDELPSPSSLNQTSIINPFQPWFLQ